MRIWSLPQRIVMSTATLLALAFFATGIVGASASAIPKEPFFPHSGNRGYDIRSYDVSLGYEPRSGQLNVRDEIEAKATQPLSRFALDLDGLTVTSVSVDGEGAEWSRGRGKVKIVPPKRLERGERFTVELSYGGHPRKVIDPDGSPEGWYRTRDGAIGVGEPVGTAAWLACDNAPRDKASFAIEITVPAGLKAISNGRLLSRRKVDRRVRWSWSEPAPMATYLALVDIGAGKLVTGRIGNLPTWTLVDPKLARKSSPALASLPEILHWESRLYGRYPFAAAGSVVDVARLGYALETQSRPIYAFAPDRTTVVHETAHQWFGDSVSLERWPDIWLNEGFATWTQWYYAETHGGRSATDVFAELRRRPPSAGFWNPPTGNPGQARNLFDSSTYVRGAMTLQALRERIGTPAFLRILRTWVAEHRHGNADTARFIALAIETSRRHLGTFFNRWLFRPGKP